MSAELHVIFGTGPVGCWTARELRRQGRAVRAVNRSGVRPGLMPAAVEVIKADVADPVQARAVASGASVVYQALNTYYHLWHALFPALQANVLAAARDAQAKYVSIENLYMYDASKPITEDSPVVPVSQKGAVRQAMAEEIMAAHRRGDVRTTALRASDYYGPGVLISAFGERVVGPVLAGKKAQILGSTAMPHSFAYSEDVGCAAALLGTNDRALGQAWIAPHAPARTQGEMLGEMRRVLGIDPPRSVMTPFMMRMVGLFVPAARASVEMMYEFTAPFVVDSSRIEREFGLSATPIPVGIERTIAWYREHLARG